MKKKFFVSLSLLILAAVLAVGLVYALFSSVSTKGLTFNFSELSQTVRTQAAQATFAKPGDAQTIALTVSSGSGAAPFGYEISIVPSDASDDDLMRSVLVYLDGELLGTAASAMPKGAAFGASASDASRSTLVFSPDRILNTDGNGTTEETASHELKLEYHAGAGSVHVGKKLDLSVSVRANTLDASTTAVVRSVPEYEDILRHLSAGRLPDGYRVVLDADIVSTKAFSVATPFVLDLNGHNLTSDLTVTSGASEVRSYLPATITGLTVNGANAFVYFDETAAVAAGVFSTFDRASAARAIAADAEKVLYGVSGTGAYTLDFARGNKTYLIADPTLASVSNGDGAAVSGIAVDGATGLMTITAPSETVNAVLTVTDGAAPREIAFTVYGTTPTTASEAELDALMAGQGLNAGTTTGGKPAIRCDLLLPRVLAGTKANVAWSSDLPGIISPRGKYLNVDFNGGVVLTAVIEVNNVVAVKQYTATVQSIKNNQEVFDRLLSAYGNLEFNEIGEQHFIPVTEGNLDAQKTAMGGLYAGAEAVKWDNVAAAIRGSGITNLTYATNPPSLTADRNLVIGSNNLIRLESSSPIHVAKLHVTATFDTEPTTCEGDIVIYINVASVAEAWRYFTSAFEERGDIATNIRDDRYHTVSSEGYDRGGATPDNTSTFAYHSGSVNTSDFGTGTALNRSVREGSFILPTQFNSASDMSFAASGSTVVVYYYFVYRLEAADGTAVDLGADFDTDFTTNSGNLASVTKPFNNFFLVDPSKLPGESTSYTLRVGMYQKAGENQYARMDVQSFSLNVPAAIHQDEDGFEDVAVFDAFWDALAASATVYDVVTNKVTPCAANGVKDTIVADLASKVTEIAIESTAANPIQAQGSVTGLSAFSGLTSLTIKGTEGKDFFVTDTATTTVSFALSQLTRLTTLTMNYCGVTGVGFATGMASLAKVDFSNNAGLNNIEGFLLLDHIDTLDVSYCGFGFTEQLSWESVHGAVSVFDALYYSAGNTKIYYTYNSGSGDVKTQYNPGASRLTLTDNARLARRYVLSFNPIGGYEVSTFVHLPLQVFGGGADTVIGYRMVAGFETDPSKFRIVNSSEGTVAYKPVTITGGIPVVSTQNNKDGYLYVPVASSAASGSKAIIQVFVKVGTGDQDFYARYYEFTVV